MNHITGPVQKNCKVFGDSFVYISGREISEAGNALLHQHTTFFSSCPLRKHIPKKEVKAMRTAIKKLKALFDFLRMPDDSFVSRLTAIHDKLLGNPAFPNPPVDLAAFLAAITTFAASVVVALDGSKQAIAIKNKQREGLVKMAEHLGHYVEAVSNNDPLKFTSSGFQIRSMSRSPLQLLDQPVIERLDQGKSGELLAIVKPVPGARTYEIQYAPSVTGGAFPVWTKMTIAGVRKPVPVENLTPGTTYMFQVRAFGNSGFTDWSQPVQRMCI